MTRPIDVTVTQDDSLKLSPRTWEHKKVDPYLNRGAAKFAPTYLVGPNASPLISLSDKTSNTFIFHGLSKGDWLSKDALYVEERPNAGLFSEKTKFQTLPETKPLGWEKTLPETSTLSLLHESAHTVDFSLTPRLNSSVTPRLDRGAQRTEHHSLNSPLPRRMTKPSKSIDDIQDKERATRFAFAEHLATKKHANFWETLLNALVFPYHWLRIHLTRKKVESVRTATGLIKGGAKIGRSLKHLTRTLALLHNSGLVQSVFEAFLPIKLALQAFQSTWELFYILWTNKYQGKKLYWRLFLPCAFLGLALLAGLPMLHAFSVFFGMAAIALAVTNSTLGVRENVLAWWKQRKELRTLRLEYQRLLREEPENTEKLNPLNEKIIRLDLKLRATQRKVRDVVVNLTISIATLLCLVLLLTHGPHPVVIVVCTLLFAVAAFKLVNKFYVAHRHGLRTNFSAASKRVNDTVLDRAARLINTLSQALKHTMQAGAKHVANNLPKVNVPFVLRPTYKYVTESTATPKMDKLAPEANLGLNVQTKSAAPFSSSYWLSYKLSNHTPSQSATPEQTIPSLNTAAALTMNQVAAKPTTAELFKFPTTRPSEEVPAPIKTAKPEAEQQPEQPVSSNRSSFWANNSADTESLSVARTTAEHLKAEMYEAPSVTA